MGARVEFSVTWRRWEGRWRSGERSKAAGDSHLSCPAEVVLLIEVLSRHAFVSFAK